MTLKTAYKNELGARQKFLIATEQSDGLRTDLAKKVWEDAQAELTAARMPPEGLKTGAGGEIIPPTCLGMSGLENVLKKADLLNAQATIERANLADRAGVFDLAFDAAESVSAKNSVEQMLCHQMAAAHRRAMLLIAESEACQNSEVAVKKARASARLLDAFSRSALTLKRLQSGASQVIQIQHIQVVGHAVVNHVTGANENLQNPPIKNRGGRPPTSGDRTAKAIGERRQDRELLQTLASTTSSL
jgi:hypothetical protein